jgi:hypothetical protein
MNDRFWPSADLGEGRTPDQMVMSASGQKRTSLRLPAAHLNRPSPPRRSLAREKRHKLTAMTWRRLQRIAMHLLLVAFLAIPAVAAPARAVADAMQAAAASAMSDASVQANVPCDAMRASSDGQQPCDCCVDHTCDISACLGTGCLPELPRLIASIPAVGVAAPWRQRPVPTGTIETPFRPPIA